MKKCRKSSRGITLIALVITIIVLLILAGISIQAITNTGLFAQASQAKKETQRAQVTEWLNLKLMEEQMYNPTGSAEEIIEATRVASEGNTELAQMGKSVGVDTNTSTIEDGEPADVYFYVQVDEDVYKVDMTGAKFIGEKDKFPPEIKIESITGTTNTITVKIKTIRNEEGTLEIYIKSEDDTEYTREKIATGEEATGIEYKFENLEQNKKYSIKIVATAKNEQVKEYTTYITLGSVPEGEGLIVFSPVTWSGGKASTTISSTEKGYSIQYQVNNTSESGWTTGTSVTGLVHGDKVYARLWDGTNGGTASAAYNILDGTAPSASISLSATTVGTTGSITATVTHTDNESGVDIENCKWVYNTTSSAIGTDVSSYSGTFSSASQTITLSATTAGTYYLHVLTTDVAGRKVETISNAVTVVKLEKLASKVSVGDYVAYNALAYDENDQAYSYTSPTGSGPSHGNGYISQTFTSSSDIKWRVLSKDTSTGEVVLISEAPVLTDDRSDFYMNGTIGYLYAEQELNNICAIYGHGTGANTSKTFSYVTGDLIEGTTTGTITGSGARSINVEDINAITGYTPSAATTPYTKSIYYPTKTTLNGKSTSAANRTDKHTYYSYTGSSYLTSTEEPYKMLFRNTSDSSNISYWLASRCVYSYSSASDFRVVNVFGGDV